MLASHIQRCPAWVQEFSKTFSDQAQQTGFNAGDSLTRLAHHIAITMQDIASARVLKKESWYVVSKAESKPSEVGPRERPPRSYRILLVKDHESWQLLVPVILRRLHAKRGKKINYALEFSCELLGSFDNPAIDKAQVTATIYFRTKGYFPTLVGRAGLQCHATIDKLALKANIAALPMTYYVAPEKRVEWSQIRYASDWSDIHNLSLEQHLSIAQSITKALLALHHHGIVHRDVTPRNIFIDKCSQGFLGDFDHTQTSFGELEHTFALERRYPYWDSAAHQDIASPFTDVYGLGVTLVQITSRILQVSAYEYTDSLFAKRAEEAITLENYRNFAKSILQDYRTTAIAKGTWNSATLTPTIVGEIRCVMACCHLFSFIEKIVQADITLQQRLRHPQKREDWIDLLESKHAAAQVLDDMHTFSPSLEELDTLLTALQNYTPEDKDLNFLLSMACTNDDYQKLVELYPLSPEAKIDNFA